ncbi:hypothetical protein [Streptomyces mexicanus]|uniref:hypothetical protein n=1 Tax=Streptomyces mexicanus TaxID=178566 RepID=UPI0031EE14D9
MATIRSLTVAAAAAALLTLAVAAHPALAATDDACTRAQGAAEAAQQEFDEAKRGYEAQIAAGGHPGAAERQALADADVRRSRAAAEAERICDSVA